MERTEQTTEQVALELLKTKRKLAVFLGIGHNGGNEVKPKPITDFVQKLDPTWHRNQMRVRNYIHRDANCLLFMNLVTWDYKRKVTSFTKKGKDVYEVIQNKLLNK